MERRDRNTRDRCHGAEEITISRRIALGSSGLALLGLLSGPSLAGERGQPTDRSEHDAAIKARLDQRKAFGERIRNAGSAEERTKMMEEIRAMDRQRAIESFKGRLGLSDPEWTVIKPRIETVYGMVHSRPTTGGGASRKKTEVEQKSGELRALLENREADASRIKAGLDDLRAVRRKAEQELAKARQDLRQLLNLRQEAILVLEGLLD